MKSKAGAGMSTTMETITGDSVYLNSRAGSFETTLLRLFPYILHQLYRQEHVVRLEFLQAYNPKDHVSYRRGVDLVAFEPDTLCYKREVNFTGKSRCMSS